MLHYICTTTPGAEPDRHVSTPDYISPFLGPLFTFLRLLGKRYGLSSEYWKAKEERKFNMSELHEELVDGFWWCGRSTVC